jgi:hypothetical protein
MRCSSPTALAFPNAGEISFTRRGTGETVSLVPEEDGRYSGLRALDLDALEGTEFIDFETAGADVPAVAVSVSLPPRVEVTSTGVVSDSVTVAPRDTELLLTWIPHDANDESLTLTVQATSDDVLMSCSVSLDVGEIEVPVEALAQFPAGETLEVFVVNSVAVVAGDYDVRFRNVMAALSSETDTDTTFALVLE